MRSCKLIRAAYNMKKQPQSRVKKNSRSYLLISIIISALLTFAFYFYIAKTDSGSLHQSERTPSNRLESLDNGPGKSSGPPDLSQGMENDLVTMTNDSSNLPAESGAAEGEATLETTALAPETTTEEAKPALEPYESSSLETTTAEKQLLTDINNWYDHLDEQDYMQTYQLNTSSKIHFSQLLQKLLDNPPVVTRETDDLFTLLKNTAHFFRILGKNNILMLKGILDREKDSFEHILQSFYNLLDYPKALDREYSLNIPVDSLYDYSGFFLNTMGGRLYLFRRDSTSRMLVSFYAILVIDRVKDSGSDRHGLDLKKPIDSLIDELENTGKRLRLRDKYLDVLYDLKEKYTHQ